MTRITKQGYKFELTKIIQGLTRYTEIDEIMTRLAQFEDAEESQSKGCEGCYYKTRTGTLPCGTCKRNSELSDHYEILEVT